MNKETLSAFLAALTAGNLSAENLTREQIDKFLDELAEKPAPDAKIFEGVSCYDMMMPPDRIEYVCPVCGEKTIHAHKGFYKEPTWSLRHQTKRIKELGLDIKLDETDLCNQCRLDKNTDTIQYYIVVNLDGKIKRSLVKENDWEILIAFLEGKNAWEPDGGIEPLKPHLPRIRELLGIEEEIIPDNETPLEQPEKTSSKKSLLWISVITLLAVISGVLVWKKKS